MLSSGAWGSMNWVRAIEPHAPEDKEILYYSSVEELADKIRYLTNEERDGVRAGQISVPSGRARGVTGSISGCCQAPPSTIGALA